LNPARVDEGAGPVAFLQANTIEGPISGGERNVRGCSLKNSGRKSVKKYDRKCEFFSQGGRYLRGARDLQ
jgi:hypothetical protein